MGLMSIVWTIIVGFIVGLIARAIMPGMDALGFWFTALLGIERFAGRRCHREPSFPFSEWAISSGRVDPVDPWRRNPVVGLQPLHALKRNAEAL